MRTEDNNVPNIEIVAKAKMAIIIKIATKMKSNMMAVCEIGCSYLNAIVMILKIESSNHIIESFLRHSCVLWTNSTKSELFSYRPTTDIT